MRGHSSIFNFLSELVFGCRLYLLDVVLCFRVHFAFLHVAQSGLWDGLHGFNGLPLMIEMLTVFLLLVFVLFVLCAVFLDPGIYVWDLWGFFLVNLVGCVRWWYCLL